MSRFSFHLAALILVIVATLIGWGTVPWGTFQFDDFQNVVRDPATIEPSAFLHRLAYGLRPLTRLSYFIDAKLFGFTAAGFLSTNLLLHLFTVLLTFELARRRISLTGAWIAALLFALQPANAEVVAYASGRSTGLMTPLLIGGLLLYDRGRSIAAMILFTLACLAKEVALVFPALLLLWELTRHEPESHSKRLIVISALVAAITFAFLISLASYRSVIGYSMELRPVVDNLLANGRAIPVMLSLWFRPWALSADHGFDPSDHLITSVVGLILITAVIMVALRVRRRNPMLTLALLWPVIALLPTNSVIPKLDLVTERALYLAWVGPSIAVGAAASKAFAMRTLRGPMIVATAVLTCALAGAAFWRASVWRNPVLLWQEATTKAPTKSRCWNNLGVAYLAVERDADAVAAFERALELDPSNEYAASNLTTTRVLCGDPCK